MNPVLQQNLFSYVPDRPGERLGKPRHHRQKMPRAGSLDARFAEWITRNPKMIFTFLSKCRELRRRGVRRYSIKAVAEVVRWHFTVESASEEFKVNNSYLSRLALHLEAADPALLGLFSHRALISKK